MFARFTPEAREAVVLAQEEAVRLGHPWLGTEHLLLALLHQPESRAKVVLSDLGITAESIQRRLANELGEGSAARDFGDEDEEILRTLGIDLGEIRRRVEATFGPAPWSSRVRDDAGCRWCPG
jgi:ATP-dependent Clp protease ATP-binding subunit ClpA